RPQRGGGGGEPAGPRRVEDDREVGPVGWSAGGGVRFRARRLAAFAVDDVFQFIEQLLGAADAEGGNQHAAAIGQGALDHPLQALAAAAAILVQAVTVGAFDHQGVGAVGRLRRRQQRRVRGRSEERRVGKEGGGRGATGCE